MPRSDNPENQTMTKTHTPGPWGIRAHDLMQRIETRDGHTVAIPAMNDGVSALASSGNARLIATTGEDRA